MLSASEDGRIVGTALVLRLLLPLTTRDVSIGIAITSFDRSMHLD